MNMVVYIHAPLSRYMIIPIYFILILESDEEEEGTKNHSAASNWVVFHHKQKIAT